MSQQEELQRIVQLLEHFRYGYRFSSIIDYRKLQGLYKERYSVTLDSSKEAIEELLKPFVIEHEGYYFLPDQLLEKDKQMLIEAYLDKTFKDGISRIYYDALFENFKSILETTLIRTPNQLKKYLERQIEGYFFSDSFISITSDMQYDPEAEILCYLKNQVTPVTVEKIHCDLPHIGLAIIRKTVLRNPEIIKNTNTSFFHHSLFDSSEKDCRNIKSLLKSQLSTQGFLSVSEACDLIKEKYPLLYEKNNFLTRQGWKGVFSVKFNQWFSISENIIAPLGTTITMGDAYKSFANRAQFTIQELSKFAENMGTQIYFEDVYSCSLRINETDFLNKSSVTFDSVQIDCALDSYCSGDFCSLSSITDYSLLPTMELPWNIFLLESYLSGHSQKFKLMHRSYNVNYCSGAIVRKNSNITNFDDLVVEIILQQQLELKKEPILDYLATNGFIARRAYENIESLIIRARTRRNRGV